jgi:hypothetical protein
MIKVGMAVLTVLVLASAAFAAYPVNHPCLATQSLDPLTGVVTSVAPEQKATPLAGAVASADPAQKVAAFKGSVTTSADPVQCPASYFGAQDADRRIDPESSGDSGSSGGDGG